MAPIKRSSLLIMTSIRILALLAISITLAPAEVRVSNLFGDNMVLQRGIPAPIWGRADPGERVTVRFGDAQVTAEADANGKWMVKLPAMQANATPQELTILGKNTLTMKNVLVGDREFLRRRAYPAMKEAAQFVLDFLVEAPAGTACPGALVTNPSFSPENWFRTPNGAKAVQGPAAGVDRRLG